MSATATNSLSSGDQQTLCQVLVSFDDVRPVQVVPSGEVITLFDDDPPLATATNNPSSADQHTLVH
ncbi:MAG: hypothetical protein EBY23_11155 [Actinobacteria bacterium]|nr:hypothetical protein [Actinomycetota bacterium]